MKMYVLKKVSPRMVKQSRLDTFLSLVEEEKVAIKYDLETSSGVSIASFYIGYKKIEYEHDQDPGNHDHFSSGDKTYSCSLTSAGLRVVIIATGFSGDTWKLNIEMKKDGDTKFTKLHDDPIQEKTDKNGNLDHIQFHK
ncbi:MAG: hypothetical protein EOP45_06050 [Sphingobacteriaceae bacterium]|nr:MAG: hypothetical protein EOP45_06050 [Sphingobacteriaceae bacterium]